MEEYPRTLQELEERFMTEEACREYLARLRWGRGFVCPACDGTEAWATRCLRRSLLIRPPLVVRTSMRAAATRPRQCRRSPQTRAE